MSGYVPSRSFRNSSYPLQVVQGQLRIGRVELGQGGEPEHGVEGRAHIVGHIGQELVFAGDGQIGLGQGVRQQVHVVFLRAAAGDILIPLLCSSTNIMKTTPKPIDLEPALMISQKTELNPSELPLWEQV